MAINWDNITTEQLQRILEIKQQMAALKEELNKIEGGATSPVPGRPSGRTKGKRYFSPEARAKMAAAQRRRWAAHKKAQGVTAAAAPKGKRGRKKRIMTPEALASLARAREIRLAKLRAGK